VGTKPAGPESVIEINAKTPISYTLRPIFIKGKRKVNVLSGPYPMGMFYTMNEVEQVKK